MLPLRYREPTARIVASFFKDTFACQGAACPQHIPSNFVQRMFPQNNNRTSPQHIDL